MEGEDGGSSVGLMEELYRDRMRRHPRYRRVQFLMGLTAALTLMSNAALFQWGIRSWRGALFLACCGLGVFASSVYRWRRSRP